MVPSGVRAEGVVLLTLFVPQFLILIEFQTVPSNEAGLKFDICVAYSIGKVSTENTSSRFRI